MDVLDEHVDRLRRRLLATVRHVHGARMLMHEIYGVGAMISLVLCAWLRDCRTTTAYARSAALRSLAGGSVHNASGQQRVQCDARAGQLLRAALLPVGHAQRILDVGA
jgi:hypothetical protein